MKRKILSIVFASLITFTVIASVGAQNTGNGFRVSPVREEYSIEKGKSVISKITVENVTGENINAFPIVNDFESSDEEGGQPRILLDGETSQSGNSFKSLVGPIPTTPLKPGEKKTLDVKITVPENANSGGYYGAIRFAPKELDDQEQVTLSASVGVIYLIKVPGEIVEKLELFTLAAGSGGGSSNFFLSPPEYTVARLKNTGNIHLQPFGRIQVKDWRGKVISNQEFNNSDPRANVLPGSIRRFDTPIDAKASFGRYKIEAFLGYGTETSELINASTTIWVIPIWFVVVVAVLVVGIITLIGVWQRRKRKTRRYR